MELLETKSASSAGVRADPIDIATSRAMQLRALLATTTISHQTGELYPEHMANVLWLATDLVSDVIDAVGALI
ncbi:hypothetical protein [Paraburkholderia sp. D1E]|uniref:hypothetical protein n=1 Tax=Paraburkholderia sp. D1E TaxID=3461398 RepID=UPI004045EBDC